MQDSPGGDTVWAFLWRPQWCYLIWFYFDITLSRTETKKKTKKNYIVIGKVFVALIIGPSMFTDSFCCFFELLSLRGRTGVLGSPHRSWKRRQNVYKSFKNKPLHLAMLATFTARGNSDVQRFMSRPAYNVHIGFDRTRTIRKQSVICLQSNNLAFLSRFKISNQVKLRSHHNIVR